MSDSDDDLFAGLHREPYAKIPGGVFTCGISESAVVLYGWLSARYGGFKGGIFPATGTLCSELGWSRAKLKRIRRELVSAGWLTVTERPGQSSLCRLVASSRKAADLRKRRSSGGGGSSMTRVTSESGGGSLVTHPGGSLMSPETTRTETATTFLTEANSHDQAFAGAPARRANLSRDNEITFEELFSDGNPGSEAGIRRHDGDESPGAGR